MTTETYDPAASDPSTDPFMREIDEAIVAGQTKPYFAPFFLILKVGQQALVRFLVNMNEGIAVMYHERYTPANGYEVAAVCGRSYLTLERDAHGKPTGKYKNSDDNYDDCAHCVAFEAGEKKLKPRKRFYWPVYIHWVAENVLDENGKPTGKRKQVMYKDQNDKEQPMQGLRILEVKGGEQRLVDLNSLYNTLDDPDFTQFDFLMHRVTGGKDTKYAMPPKFPTAKNPLRPLPQELNVPTRDQLKIDVATNKPYKLVSGKTIGDPEPESEPEASETEDWAGQETDSMDLAFP